MQFFYDLGSLVEERWKAKNYDETVFPEIAEEALCEMNCIYSVSPWDIIRYLHTSTQLLTQEDDEFSDLPITLYRGPRFLIEAYFWLDGTTAIHQHGFSGAFNVLLGSSIHSQYSFEEEQRINERFSVGQILLKQVELLAQGNIRRIYPGREFIHSLFHLDRPSVTITVRTYRTPSAQPQYAYLAPYVAMDPFFNEPSLKKKLHSVVLLLRMEHPNANSLITELVTSSDFQSAFSILKSVSEFLNSERSKMNLQSTDGQERFRYFLEMARRQHGSLVDILPPVFDELQRKSKLVARRKYITSPEHRFFLALLLNVTDRTLVLELVKQRFPQQDPIEIISNWVREISTIKASKKSTSDTTGETFNEVHMFILRCLLKGQSPEQTKSALEKEYGANAGPGLQDEFEELCCFLQNSILKTLLFGPPPSGHSEALVHP
jgi:hypothetical protein